MRAPTVISVLAYTSYCNSVHCEVPPRLSSLLPYSRRDERRPVRLEMTLIALCGIPPAPTRVTLYATPPRKYTRATPLVNFCLGTSAQTQTDPISNPNPTPTPNRLRGSRSAGRSRGSTACFRAVFSKNNEWRNGQPRPTGRPGSLVCVCVYARARSSHESVFFLPVVYLEYILSIQY